MESFKNRISFIILRNRIVLHIWEYFLARNSWNSYGWGWCLSVNPFFMDHLRRSKVAWVVFEVITGDFPIDALQHSNMDDAFATLTLSSFQTKENCSTRQSWKLWIRQQRLSVTNMLIVLEFSNLRCFFKINRLLAFATAVTVLENYAKMSHLNIFFLTLPKIDDFWLR